MPENETKHSRFYELLKRFLRVSEKKKITLNRQVLIFSFFLLLSILFWFLTALNKEYESLITYPVRYIRYPEGKVLVNEVPERLELRVNASGYILLGYHLRSKRAPIIFDVNSFSLNTLAGDPSRVYILSSIARERIEAQLSSEVSILDIRPDSLIFQFAEQVEKFVAVKPAFSLELAQQYMQTGPVQIEPDTVLIAGPGPILDTLAFLPTEKRQLQSISESLDLQLDISLPNKLEADPPQVRVNIPVERFTEASLRVPIEVLNIPDSLVLRTFPASVTVSCQVGLSAYETLSEHLFRAVVDYAEAGSQLGSKLQVKLVQRPSYVQSVNHTPKSVEYIIEK